MRQEEFDLGVAAQPVQHTYGPVEYWPPTMHPKYIFPKDVLA